MLVMNSVNWFRFFFIIVELDRFDCILLLNSVDSLLFLVWCSSINNIISMFVMISVICRVNFMMGSVFF